MTAILKSREKKKTYYDVVVEDARELDFTLCRLT